MKTYTVTVARDQREYAEVVIKAKTKSEARKQLADAVADENANGGNDVFIDVNWRTADEPGDVQAINDLEEIEELDTLEGVDANGKKL